MMGRNRAITRQFPFNETKIIFYICLSIHKKTHQVDVLLYISNSNFSVSGRKYVENDL